MKGAKLMWTKTKGTKCCATCANWRGPRRERGNAIETDQPSTRGKCGANVFCGVTEGPTAMQGTSCSKYIPW